MNLRLGFGILAVGWGESGSRARVATGRVDDFFTGIFFEDFERLGDGFVVSREGQVLTFDQGDDGGNVVGSSTFVGEIDHLVAGLCEVIAGQQFGEFVFFHQRVEAIGANQQSIAGAQL